ncbi:ABC transporter substrate-binding protein [Xanthobacter autotrophicus DSM 431]|uniref:ABC transporter substrate-binding protein n=1 Tax=Xanthobacter nonsaccharivorans TaxID=3119912 RepID=UPI00372BAF2C
MRRTLTGLVAASALAALSLALVPARPAVAADAICYNCPPEWADWGAMLKAIKADLGIDVPQDNKNSGQSLAQILAEKASPVADVAYLGVTFGIKAKDAGVTQPYEPKGFSEIPDGLKDKDGNWFTIHSGTLGLFVNKDALGGAPVPACWADLLKPEYKGLVGYLDPTSAFVGYVGAVAVNGATGGSLDDFKPGIEYFRKLQANGPIVPKQTSYARVVSGEIPILFDYDFNAYRAKYSEKGNFAFVIPCEGTVVVPYVMTMVKGAPHPEAAKKILDYVLSDKGQAMWAKAYLRPARNVELPKEVADRFLPAADYARAKPVDYAKMEAAQKGFSEAYLNAVK